MLWLREGGAGASHIGTFLGFSSTALTGLGGGDKTQMGATCEAQSDATGPAVVGVWFRGRAGLPDAGQEWWRWSSPQQWQPLLPRGE